MSEPNQSQSQDGETESDRLTIVELTGGFTPNKKPSEQKTRSAADKICRYLKAFGYFLIKPKTLLEVAALVVVICYTRYAHQQVAAMNATLDEIKKQTPQIEKSAKAAEDSAKLTRQTTEGTQAAFITMGVNGDSRWSDDGKTIITYPTGAVHWENSGKVAATNLTADLALEVKTFPGEKLLRSKPIQIHRDWISAGTQNGSAGEQPYVIDDWTNIQQLFFEWKLTATIRGKFTYINGFNRSVSETVCYQIVPQYAPTQTPRIVGASWVECRQVPDWLRRFERAKTEVPPEGNANKTQKKQ